MFNRHALCLSQIMQIVCDHPRSTNTIAWCLWELFGSDESESDVLVALLELRELGKVKIAFSFSDETYWVLIKKE